MNFIITSRVTLTQQGDFHIGRPHICLDIFTPPPLSAKLMYCLSTNLKYFLAPSVRMSYIEALKDQSEGGERES